MRFTLLLLLAALVMAPAAIAQKGHASASADARSGELPANDTYSTGFPIYAGQTTYSGSNAGATAEADNNPSASCAFGGPDSDGDNSVYWMVRSTSTGELTIDLDGSSFDTILTLLDGFDLSEVDCNDDDPANPDGDYTSRMVATVSANFVYVVRVTGYDGESGTIALSVEGGSVISGPPNDPAPGSGFVLPLEGPGLYSDTNVGATANDSEASASCQGNDGGNSVWRFFTAPITGNVTFDLRGSGFDTIATVYDAVQLSPVGTEIGCDDDGIPGDGDTTSILTVAVTEGNTYAIRVSGFNGQEGMIVMDYSITPPTANEGPLAGDGFVLAPVAPNPVHGAATVALSLTESAQARVEAFDVLGRSVAVLHDGPLAAGETRLTWTPDDLPTGTYVLRATADGAVRTQRVTVVR